MQASIIIVNTLQPPAKSQCKEKEMLEALEKGKRKGDNLHAQELARVILDEPLLKQSRKVAAHTLCSIFSFSRDFPFHFE
jgi:hypothetical protein